MNTYDEWCRLLEAYGEALGDQALKRLSCHISGIEYTQKGEKNHLPIQESDLDLEAVLKALHKFKCGGRILSESPIMEEDAQLVKDTWMKVSGESED